MLSALGAGSAAFAQIENELNLTNNNAEIKDLAGVNSLMSAVANNDVEGVKFFTKAGSKTINEKNIGGGTALLIACRNGNLQIVQMLIKGGADVNITDNEGFSPLMRAAIAKNLQIVSLLINSHANIFLTNVNNETALVHATTSDCDTCLAQILLATKSNQKIDSDFLLKQLMMSFSIAQNRQNDKTKTLLQKHLDGMPKEVPVIAIGIKRDNVDAAVTNQEFTNKDKNVKYVFGSSAQKIEEPVSKFEAKQVSVQQNISQESDGDKKPAFKFKFITGLSSSKSGKGEVVAPAASDDGVKDGVKKEQKPSYQKSGDSKFDISKSLIIR